jgi:hypothetical protein
MSVENKPQEFVHDTQDFESTDDQRVDNNSTRHNYRTLTDDEKKQVQTIKDIGSKIVDNISVTSELAAELAAEYDNIKSTSDASLAFIRLVEAFGGSIDPETSEPVYSDAYGSPTIKIQESVMWAVRSITA